MLALAGCAPALPAATVPLPVEAAAKALPGAPVPNQPWAFATGVVEAGALSMGVALKAHQDPVTGKFDGTLFASQATVLNTSFLGRITGGQIQPNGTTRTAHLTGLLVDNRPFSVDLVEDAPGDRDLVTVELGGITAISGQLHGGDLRIALALPLGQDFRGTPGVIYDFQMGLFVRSADGPGGPDDPADIPDGEFVPVAFDPEELPNGTRPGTWNTLPGIGFNLPVFQDDLPNFPQGVPLLDPDHPKVLGLNPFGA
jgi:hypothetical protein